MKTSLRVLSILILPVFLVWFKPAAQTNEFWGILSSGGSENIGAIFKTNGNGENLVARYEFKADNTAKYPNSGKLCETADGKLYGITMFGGSKDMGTIYEFDPAAGILTVKYEFNVTSGGWSEGGLIQADNGRLYGTTSGGGSSGEGVIFEYDPEGNSFEIKYSFDGGINGGNPRNSLLLGDNGKLYGVAGSGGEYWGGVLFEYDTEKDLLNVKVNFNYNETGECPESNLIKGTGGIIYGSACSGGQYGYGVIFEYDSENDIFRKLINFDLSSTGMCPRELVYAGDGKLYGLLSYSPNSYGIDLISYDPLNDTLEHVWTFNDYTQGANPNDKLLLADNGRIYGTTMWDGDNQSGVIFEFDIQTGTYSKIFDFPSDPNGSSSGVLMQSRNGTFYGIQGLGGDGSIYTYSLETGAYDVLFNFNYAENGKYPDGCLLNPGNGKLYGTCNSGGKNNGGIVFQFDPETSEIIKKLDVADFDIGMGPMFGLTPGNNGKLYGLTSYGGKYSQGTLFECDKELTYLKKITDFNDATVGYYPGSKLIAASNGMLYGSLVYGGYDMAGSLFEFDPVKGTCRKLKQFGFYDTGDGVFPTGILCEAEKGILYGVTSMGGPFDRGTIFKYDIENNEYTKVYNFTSYATIGNPVSGLVKGQNGKLYGLCGNGGFYGLGGLFEFDPGKQEITQDLDFGWIGGTGMPTGELMAASNGKIYGFTEWGLNSLSGVLFEYNPEFNILKKKADLPGSAYGCALVEEGQATGIYSHDIASFSRVYPNPNNGHFRIEMDQQCPDFHVIIKTTEGRILEERQFEGSSAEITIAGPQGIYFLEIRTPENHQIVKVIKQ